MILLDFSQVIYGQIHNDLARGEDNSQDIGLFRHLVINQIRSYNKKYRDRYGHMIVCIDPIDGYWRRDFFEFYKYSRKISRDDSDLDWDKLFEAMNQVREELRENLPQLVLEVPKCEADDLIAVLVKNIQDQRHMIISSDKDFRQLQKYSHVDQYSPIVRKKIIEKNPDEYRIEHTIRGDTGDGVPNIKTPSNFFPLKIEGKTKRQKPITKKFVDEAIHLWKEGEEQLLSFLKDEGLEKRWNENKTLVDLIEGLPSHIEERILTAFYKQLETHIDKKTDLNKYFFENKLIRLIEDIPDFMPPRDGREILGVNIVGSDEKSSDNENDSQPDLMEFMK